MRVQGTQVSATFEATALCGASPVLAFTGNFAYMAGNQLTGTCSATYAVTGSVGGLGFTLASPSDPLTGYPNASISGATNPTATLFSAVTVNFRHAPCNTAGSVYNGSLTIQ